MRTVLRFSAAVAFSRDRRQRWRQVCLLAASFIATFAVLVALGLIALSYTSPLRAGAMLGVPTAAVGDEYPGMSAEGAVAAVVDRGTLAMDRQVPTVWIEPMAGHEDDPTAVPPGLDELPGPGEAVLSPALVAAGYTAEDFGWLSSAAGSGTDGTIGDEGLAAASEPLIFVRPEAGTTLGEGGAVTYIATYAQSDPNAVYGGHSYDPDVVSVTMMAPGVAIFLVVPSLVLLVSSSRARSLVRDERLRFLHTLGVRARTARTAMACETGLLALSGALIAVLAHAVFGRWLTVIPATSIRLFPGDLSLPWWVYLPAVAVTAGCAFFCGALGRLLPRRRSRRPRAGHMIAVAGLAAAVLTVIASATSWISPSVASTVFVGGTIGVIIFLPLAVPTLSAAAASSMRTMRSPVLWAAARRLRHDAVHLSRVASVLGVLIVVVSFAVALWGSAAATQAEGSSSHSSRAIAVGWRGDPEGGLEAARDAFAEGGRDVLIVSTISQDDTDGPMPRLIDVDDCASFVAYFNGDNADVCAPGNEHELSDFAEANTGMRTPDDTTRLAPDDGLGDDVAIFSRDPLSTQDVQRALGFLPALNINLTASDVTAPLPIVQWLVAGALVAFIILGLAIVREIGDRSVEDSGRDMLYQRLGLSLHTSDKLAWTVLLIPLVVSTVTAFFCSLVISYAGEVLQIAKGDTLKLVLVAAISLALPIGAILLTIPARRAAASVNRR